MPTRRWVLFGLVAWACVVAAGIAVVRVSAQAGDRAFPDAPPLYGVLEPLFGPRALAALAVLTLFVAVGPTFAERARWDILVVSGFLGTGLWAAVLAWVRGTSVFTDPLVHRTEFLATLPLIGSPAPFLRTFSERLSDYTVHVQGHPPGVPLLLWAADRIGVARPGPLAAFLIAVGASATAAALLALREVADEGAARRAAPFLVLAPAALWVATSMDALYLGLGAWCVAGLVLATGRRGLRSTAYAVGGGLAGAAALFATYGAAPLGLIVLVVAVVRRRIFPLVVGAGAIVLVGIVFAGAGFVWTDGLSATAMRYEAGIAAVRPYAAFLVLNLAAFAVTVGPAGVGALATLRDRRVWLLAGPALAAIAFADLSGLSRGEVERIWLLFVPWILVSTGGIKRDWARPLLALNGVFALGLAIVVHTKW